MVFYNGTDKLPERMELKLSDAFSVPVDNPELELKVQILNINPGMNEELKAKCPVLREYVIYVEKVRNYARTMPLEKAVERAIEECIQDDILREFLSKQKAEVVKVSIYEYDEEKELKLIREDERALGEEIGKEIGRAEERINTEMERQRADNEKQRAEKEQKKSWKAIIALCREVGMNREQTIEQLMDKCGLERKMAEGLVGVS